MAKVGQALTAPEAGWRRIDDTDTNIQYSGSTQISPYDGNTVNGYARILFKPDGLIRFRFLGSKIRILGILNVPQYRAANTEVWIDGIKVGTISQRSTGIIYRSLDFELLNLDFKEHHVSINCVDADNIYYFDAVDIDDTGELLPYTQISSPTNLTTIAGDSQVTLSWNAVEGAAGYNVKRSTAASGPYTTIATNVTGTTYIDKTVTNGITYYYVVTAVDGSGNESANSNEASATPQASSGHGLLRITMNDSSEREYRLSTGEIESFIKWYDRTVGTGNTCYAFDDIVDLSKEYLSFDKIISFKVIPLKD
jgi:hypothetical protein